MSIEYALRDPGGKFVENVLEFREILFAPRSLDKTVLILVPHWHPRQFLNQRFLVKQKASEVNWLGQQSEV